MTTLQILIAVFISLLANLAIYLLSYQQGRRTALRELADKCPDNCRDGSVHCCVPGVEEWEECGRCGWVRDELERLEKGWSS